MIYTFLHYISDSFVMIYKWKAINMAPRLYLNSTWHEISTAQKTKLLKIKNFLAFKLSDAVFIMLINVKMPTIVGILTFISMINFMLS